MSRSFCPRLSEARHLLPLLRSHLIAVASRYPLPAGLALDLLPIVEDGLFGYELVLDRKTHTYVIIGCNAQGEPVLRKTLYGVGVTNALQLVAVDGHILSRSERASRYSTQQRDAHFPDWPAAAEAAFAQLLILFPERPRRPVTVREHVDRCLDEALSIAHSHLAHWNPFIWFCGLPKPTREIRRLCRGGSNSSTFQGVDQRNRESRAAKRTKGVRRWTKTKRLLAGEWRGMRVRHAMARGSGVSAVAQFVVTPSRHT